jgi:Flp pilus assembly pilin Flp
MIRWWGIIRRLLADDDGATMLEYGLMVTLIALAAAAAAASFGSAVMQLFDIPPV